jgi:adenylylsulfate kinase-like enzyme
MLVRAVWLNGTVGVGKTTVGHVLAEHLADASEAVAFINTDDLGTSWPRPPEDPFNVSLVTKNLGALAKNYVAAGTRTIVVAGVVQTNAQLEQFATALGTTSRLVRLVAPPTAIERRLQGRHGKLDDSGLH